MASLIKIPPKYREVLIGIASLSSAAVKELESALRNSGPALSSREEAFSLASKLKVMSEDEGMTLIEALLPLYMLKGSSTKSTEEFVDDIISSLKVGTGTEKRLTQKLATPLAGRLTKLLGLEKIDLSAKAMSVQLEQQRSLTSARILTDIRPIFGSDASKPLAGTVLVHNLKIEYVESGEEKEFFVALDKRDIQLLIDVLTRAQQKESNIKQFLAKSNLNCIEPSYGE